MGPVNAFTAVRCTEAGTAVGVLNRSVRRGRLCRVGQEQASNGLHTVLMLLVDTYEVRIEFSEIVPYFRTPFESLKPAGPFPEKCI